MAAEAQIAFAPDSRSERLLFAHEEPVPEFQPVITNAVPEAEAETPPVADLPEPAGDERDAAGSGWLGRAATELRIRIYTRSASDETQAHAEEIALQLESVGFVVEIRSPNDWRKDRESLWIGDRTLETLLTEETTNLILLPPNCDSAGAFLKGALGPRFRTQVRPADSRQHELEGAAVDTLIDLIPKRGVLERL